MGYESSRGSVSKGHKYGLLIFPIFASLFCHYTHLTSSHDKSTCSFFSLCSVTCRITFSILIMLNCWTSSCAAEPLATLSLLHLPSSSTLLTVHLLHLSMTLFTLLPPSASFPFPCLYFCLGYLSTLPHIPPSLAFPHLPPPLPTFLPPSLTPHLCLRWQPI